VLDGLGLDRVSVVGHSLGCYVALLAATRTDHLSLTTGLLLNEETALLIIANGLRLLRSTETA
jgi:pimeloyl-ACP methyl ester carboxylesterase